MSDIVFIKDENDYIEYGKLKPVKKIKRSKVKFICFCCNKESVKTYQYLKFPFICKSCGVDKARTEYKNKDLSDIPFLKDKNDYIEYGELKPISKYHYTNVRFICSRCQNESVKTYARLTEELVCEHCLRVAAHLTETFKQKFTITCQKNLGVNYPAQAKSVQDKYQETILKKYGGKSVLYNYDVKEKYKQTCLNNLGVDNPFKSKIVREKGENTCLIQYNTKNPSQSNKIQRQNRLRTVKQQREKYNKILFEHKLEFLYRRSRRSIIKCLNCNNIFSITFTPFKEFFEIIKNIDNKNLTLCPYCKQHIHCSKEQKDVYDYIKTIYSGKILEDDFSALKNREIDIYLPDLKLGFEFDGTYWHADPRFYKKDDIILNRTAEKIWENDKAKDLLCEQNNIKLIRIKEYDWRNNKTGVQEIIKNVLDELK